MREIIGGRCGVGRRRHQHAILHDDDLVVAIIARTANADIRAKAIAVFFLKLNARNDTKSAVDIRVGKLLDLFLADEGRGTTHLINAFGRSRDYQTLKDMDFCLRPFLRIGR